MGTHNNFSVRSSAASICMHFANTFPDRAPVDLLIKLSVANEDWYVQAPANAALKALAQSTPGVLKIYYERLENENADERALAAYSIHSIASVEPELLDAGALKSALKRLSRKIDREAITYLETAIPKVEKTKRKRFYRYGL